MKRKRLFELNGYLTHNELNDIIGDMYAKFDKIWGKEKFDVVDIVIADLSHRVNVLLRKRFPQMEKRS